MEAVIAIILIILMLLFDTNYMEKCIHYTKKNKIIDNLSSKLSIEYMNTSDKLGMVLDKTNPLIKPNMWIYNDYEISSREWKSFYSRRSRQSTSNIIDLCIESILKKSQNYNVRIFNQDDLKILLPEYTEYIKLCSSDYMLKNFIKYAILYKYGGIWIPKDTILTKTIDYTPNSSTHLHVFGINNLNFVDNAGISDSIIASSSGNRLLYNMLVYIKSNLRTFQNAILFKKSINKYFNKLIGSCTECKFKNELIVEKKNKSHLTVSDLFSTNNVELNNNSNSALIINIDHINTLPRYNYLMSMSRRSIQNSDVFMFRLLKK